MNIKHSFDACRCAIYVQSLMYEYIRINFLRMYVLDSGGDIEVVVASDKDVKISPVRQAFQAVFGKATVT